MGNFIKRYMKRLIAEVVNEEITKRKPEIIEDLKLTAELELLDRLRVATKRAEGESSQ